MGDADFLFSDEVDRDITRLVLDGASNRRIARELGIPEGSVKWRLHRLYRRMEVETRTQFALKLRDLAD